MKVAHARLNETLRMANMMSMADQYEALSKLLQPTEHSVSGQSVNAELRNPAQPCVDITLACRRLMIPAAVRTSQSHPHLPKTR